jgi:drug/metabolite transporter superfamily protein YnfA
VKTQWRGATYAILGTILVIISLVFMRFADENPPEGTYVPPRLENGQVVPGRFE